MKTHQFSDEEDDFYGTNHHHHLCPPDFSKSPLIIKKSSTTKSASSSIDKTVESSSNPAKWSMGSLMAALPLSPSPVCSTPTSGTGSGTHSSSRSSPLVPDISRPSAEFYTPTHHSSTILSSLSFRKQEQSPRCMSFSTLYESAIDQGYRTGGEKNGNSIQGYTYAYSPKRLLTTEALHDYELSIATAAADGPRMSCPILPRVREELNYQQKKKGATRFADFARAEPVRVEECELNSPLVNRPKPYQDFLEEVQKHKRKAELDSQRKAAYTDLLNKLKRKEAAIDCWESDQRSKFEFKLDRLERKLDKKRAKATQKMHKKVAEAKLEAEKRKARERQLILKEMARLNQTTCSSKLTAAILCLP